MNLLTVPTNESLGPLEIGQINITRTTTLVNNSNNGLRREEWIKISLLSGMFIVSSVANLHVGISISKTTQRRLSPSMHKLLAHLCLADILVVSSIIPSEIIWKVLGVWYTGDFTCKIVQFLRTFSLNLSSLILICISLDRYYTIVQPFRSIEASQRVQHMLFWTWFMSIVWAFPQLIIYRVEWEGNSGEASSACLSHWMGDELDKANLIQQLAVQYFIPFVAIVYCYSRIFYKISNTTVTVYSEANNIFLRRTGQNVIDRARMKTIKLNLVIVIAFLVCYTPNTVIVLWNIFDSKSASTNVSSLVKDILFHLMVANSCCNPVLYGIYTQKNDASQMSTATNTIELHNTLNSVHLSRDQHSRNRN